MSTRGGGGDEYWEGGDEYWMFMTCLPEGSVRVSFISVLLIVSQILTPFMLRRLKTDVDLRIPPKKEVIVYAPLRPLQKEFYAALIDRTIFAKIQQKNVSILVSVLKAVLFGYKMVYCFVV